MKIQGLAIIFVIIILPITLILGEYASAQIQTFKLEQQYDSRLITATDDALKAFQINTFNDATSDIADSKINSIEASVNAFYNSMELSFGLEGYSKEDLQMYVPAIVYTMYDGYYIYSPYTNITEINKGNPTTGEGQGVDINLNSSNIDYGFKPYVYYSCRYKIGAYTDFIINYALDNYITVQGMVDGESVYKSGYLLTIANSQNAEGVYKKKLTDGVIEYYYNGQKIEPEENLTENLVEKDNTTGEIITKGYKYVKLNGIKYYWDEDEEYIFYLMGENRVKQVTKAANKDIYIKYVDKIKINSSAIHYYESAYEFTKWVNEKLSNLETKHAVTQVQNSGAGKIFKNEQIEYPGSNFNLHRKEVIRYAIESNLSVAIANFNNYTKSGTNFQMPKLKETEWEMLENEISIISFLQGLNIGGKIYNGYTVITNNKTEEVVKEERIYISTNDGYYHKINDRHFEDEYGASTIRGGFLDLDFEVRKDGATGVSYINRNELGCYTSIVGQERVNNKYDSIYEYLQKTDLEDGIKQTYYTALARERWGTYKVEKPSDIANILDDMGTISDYTPNIVTDGLIRHLEAANTDGYGKKGEPLNGTWVDLSGHRNGIVYGTPTITSSFVEFDGNNDWVDLGIIETPNMTLEAVVQFSDTGDGYILNNHEIGGIGIFTRSGKIVASAYINGAYREIASTKAIKTNTKYNISVTYNGQVLKLYVYVDGQLEKRELSISGSIEKPKDSTVMAVGVNPFKDAASGGYAKIKVYSIKIYDRGLTQDEIQKNYKFGKIVNIIDISATPNQAEWSNSTVVVNITASTFDMSGIEKIYFKNSYVPDRWRSIPEISRNEAGNIITAQLTFEAQYRNDTVYLQAKDNAGNLSDIVTIQINHDTIAPEIKDIQVENDKITITAQDNYETGRESHYSGIKEIQYSYDNSTWITDNFDENTIQNTGNTMTITGTWDPAQYHNQTIYYRAIDNAGNVSEVKTIQIVAQGKLDLNMILDGTINYNGYSEIKVGLKVGGVDKGYVQDYWTDHPYGTTWEVYGIKINNENISYTASGTTNGTTTYIDIEFNTVTFNVNSTLYGTVTRTSLIVLKNTTFTSSGNVIKMSDGRKITANAKTLINSKITFTGWSIANGTITSATAITANFTRQILTSPVNLNVILDGKSYGTGYSGITFGLRIGGVDKGYVQDYEANHENGTIWQIYGIKINNETISYSRSGIVQGETNINIEFNTVTFDVNSTLYGTVTRTSLIVLKNTTFTSSGNVLRMSDGRRVTANAKIITNSKITFTGWSIANGTITSATAITARFSRTTIVSTGLLRNYNANNVTSSTTSWRDSSGNYTGRIKGGAKFKNNALVLDGYNDWVDIGEIGNYMGELTFEVCFELDYPKMSAHIMSDLGTTAGGVTIWHHNGALLFGAMINGKYQSISSGYNYLTAGTKYFVTATYDGSSMKLYVNGQLIASKTDLNGKIRMSPTHGIGLGASPWQVDNYAFTDHSGADAVFTRGKIYSARIYNTALTQAQIQQNIEVLK